MSVFISLSSPALHIKIQFVKDCKQIKLFLNTISQPNPVQCDVYCLLLPHCLQERTSLFGSKCLLVRLLLYQFGYSYQCESEMLPDEVLKKVLCYIALCRWIQVRCCFFTVFHTFPIMPCFLINLWV